MGCQSDESETEIEVSGWTKISNRFYADLFAIRQCRCSTTQTQLKYIVGIHGDDLYYISFLETSNCRTIQPFTYPSCFKNALTRSN